MIINGGGHDGRIIRVMVNRHASKIGYTFF